MTAARRARGTLAAVLLAATGCSTRVSLGGDVSQGGAAPSPITTGGTGASGNAGGAGGASPCADLPCGAGCTIEEDCTPDNNCAAYVGFCDEAGNCGPAQPTCAIDECLGMPCGATCTVCNYPGCEDDPAPGGGLFCDGYGSCAPQVYCDPCQPNIFMRGVQRCGTRCNPCDFTFPQQPDCPPGPDLYVCDGYGHCAYAERLECPAYDSCGEPRSTCGAPCTLCAPNSPSYRECVLRETQGPPLVCDASLTCIPLEPEPPDCG